MATDLDDLDDHQGEDEEYDERAEVLEELHRDLDDVQHNMRLFKTPDVSSPAGEDLVAGKAAVDGLRAAAEVLTALAEELAGAVRAAEAAAGTQPSQTSAP
ncbi:hypothetical protein ACVDFE_00345 [Lentzea chajnantorensis]